jgi:hypothetical protein
MWHFSLFMFVMFGIPVFQAATHALLIWHMTDGTSFLAQEITVVVAI